jgi:hypothetical protein
MFAKKTSIYDLPLQVPVSGSAGFRDQKAALRKKNAELA